MLLVARGQDAEAAFDLENRLCSFGLLQMILQVLADRQEPDVLEGAMMLVAGLRSEHNLCFLIRRRIGAFLIRIADSDAGMQVFFNFSLFHLNIFFFKIKIFINFFNFYKKNDLYHIKYIW